MAQIHVLISQQDDENILDHWWEYDDHPLNLKKWEASSCLWPSILLRGRPEPLEVFLCMDKESLAEGYNSPFVTGVVQQAHKSLWGANLYIVVDNTAQSLYPSDQEQTRQDPPAWFETSLENNVRDILQWPIRRGTNFSKAAGQSAKRMRKVMQRDPVRAWKCLIRRPPELGPEPESFLGPYLIRSLGELGDANCLLVLQEKRDNYMQYLRRLFARWPGKEMVVGLIDEIEEPPPDLERYCRDKGCAVVRFHGWYELYYILQKLNACGAGSEPVDDYATPVRVITNPTFKFHVPRLLITHSYVPEDVSGCHVAAGDTWELIKDLRGRAEVKVYPAIQCIKLAELMEELGHVLAWVHIGHGDEERGLQQSGDLIFKRPEDWLRAFAVYKSSLALALFSSCKSEPVAKRFAEAGVSVTIGFTRKVHQQVCVELTKRVIEATLNSNGSRQAILEAFRIGSQVLEIGDEDAMPVAFWARH